MTPETEKLFSLFERAAAAAWIADTEGRASDKRLEFIWKREKETREALVKRIEELERAVAENL